MRVALVHDFLMQMGGAEKVVEAFHALFPDAPVFTSAYDPKAMPDAYREWDIRTSFLQKLILKKYTHRSALLFYPAAFESFDLSRYDLVISSSSAFAKGVITQPHTTHICYTHAPMRYAWATRSYVETERIASPLRGLLAPGLHYLRTWDAIAAMRVDRYLANSGAVARRIRKFYRREAEVVHPPVDTSRFTIAPRDEVGDYGIIASRLVPYKRVDLAVKAFTKLGRPLKVIGTGRQLDALKAIAGPNVEFLGYASDAVLTELVARAKVYVMPGEEDFGIAPVEAGAAGVPVVAYAAGGALDVQVEGQTGYLFREASVESLCEALERAYATEWDPNVIRANAMRFDEASFAARIKHVVATTRPGDRRKGADASSGGVSAVAAPSVPGGVERRRDRSAAPQGAERRRRVMYNGVSVEYDRRRHIIDAQGNVIGERTAPEGPGDIVDVEAPAIVVLPASVPASPAPADQRPAPDIEAPVFSFQEEPQQVSTPQTVQREEAAPDTDADADAGAKVQAQAQEQVQAPMNKERETPALDFREAVLHVAVNGHHQNGFAANGHHRNGKPPRPDDKS